MKLTDAKCSAQDRFSDHLCRSDICCGFVDARIDKEQRFEPISINSVLAGASRKGKLSL